MPTTRTVTASPASTRPVALILVAVSSVQVGAALAKRLFPLLGASGTVAVRLATAAVVLLAIARPRVRGVRRRHLVLVAGFGLVLAVMNLSFYASLQRIPLGVAVTIEFAGPLALAVAGSRRLRDLLWATLAGSGVVVLTGGGTAFTNGSLDPLGVAFALTTAACWAGYIVLSQRVGAVLPSLQGLALAITVGAVLVLPVGVATAGRALLRPDLLAMGAAVGLLSSAVPLGAGVRGPALAEPGYLRRADEHRASPGGAGRVRAAARAAHPAAAGRDGPDLRGQRRRRRAGGAPRGGASGLTGPAEPVGLIGHSEPVARPVPRGTSWCSRARLDRIAP